MHNSSPFFSIMLNDQWYEAELARSGRSKCKEFRCKQTIDEGELRIGIKIEENDHSGDTLGWYHPACLWKTFTYKSNANVPIIKTSDIKNFNTLHNEDKAIISNLISGNTEQVIVTQVTQQQIKSNVGNARSSVKAKGNTESVALFKLSNGQLECVGETFSIKDNLKAAGGYWNGANKSWMFPAAAHEAILNLFNISSQDLDNGNRHTVDISSLLSSESSQPTNTSSAPQVKPTYAMAGTITFHLNKQSQDITFRGDTSHIAYRLLGAGGNHHESRIAKNEYWTFSTFSRANVREFLCMPDGLPPAGVEVPFSLKELGEKQAVIAGVPITAEDQAAADSLLAGENAHKAAVFQQQGEDLLLEARQALSKLKWDTRAAKKAKKNVDDTPQVVKTLPTTLDELSFEARINADNLTIRILKEFLAARGLPTTGNKDALVARLVLAGQDYLPIQDLAEYTRLARKYKLYVGNVHGGEEDALIDRLLARCEVAI